MRVHHNASWISSFDNSRGFTLFEVLVVVFVIGVIVSFATLSTQQHSDKTVEDEARRLHHLLRLAGEEAVLTSQELALMVTSTGYSFARLEGPNWTPVADDPMFRAREFPPTMQVKLKIYDREADLGNSEKPAQVFMLSSGEITPFELKLSIEDNEQVYTISGSLTGQIAYLPPGTTDELS